MTGMDRLRAALRGEPADRIPVFCNLIDQGARELGLSPREYFSRGELVAEAQLRLRERLGYDNVWSLFYVGKEAELMGCRQISFPEDGSPNVAEFVLQSPADIDRLAVPEDVGAHPAFAEAHRCLEVLRREVGGRHPICAYVTSTMTLPALLMGMERWLELLLLGPEEDCTRLLEKCHEFFVRETLAYRRAGADVLIYSNPFGSCDTVSLSFFHSRSLPWIERDLRAVGTDGLVYYCGMARMGRVIEPVLRRTGVGAFYVSPLDDLAVAKETVGTRALTCGVINDIALIDWSEPQVRHAVRRILSLGMPGGRFLFGTGVMPLAIPEANIRVMLETAYEFGCLERRVN